MNILRSKFSQTWEDFRETPSAVEIWQQKLGVELSVVFCRFIYKIKILESKQKYNKC